LPFAKVFHIGPFAQKLVPVIGGLLPRLCELCFQVRNAGDIDWGYVAEIWLFW